ncbi:hypothetical protein B005_3054 [Nocardiopsis alba ATCC BAA-2165]|uniref:Uncharacterized protein n=1 Tax=Nocardiopsis alba (strain ATCC BAA-2165 / BE74) TaxID=1205910 RepID=J7L6N9_NOCAA|nr:hypothetical protein B005_3054 [Nocardiopsis alba ATCC BAA-2165]
MERPGLGDGELACHASSLPVGRAGRARNGAASPDRQDARKRGDRRGSLRSPGGHHELGSPDGTGITGVEVLRKGVFPDSDRSLYKARATKGRSARSHPEQHGGAAPSWVPPRRAFVEDRDRATGPGAGQPDDLKPGS